MGIKNEKEISMEELIFIMGEEASYLPGILESTFCGKEGRGVEIVDYQIFLNKKDSIIVLRGKCKSCGSDVVRVIDILEDKKIVARFMDKLGEKNENVDQKPEKKIKAKTIIRVLQLKIELMDAEPLIWRRVLIKDNLTFKDLHLVIQAAMGWKNGHLFCFYLGDGTVLVDPEEASYDDDSESSKLKLSKGFFEEKQEIMYEYDFGDCWQHKITLEKILEPETGRKYPACIDGERACPPEDVGGISGFEEYVEIIKNPEHEEYEEMLEWGGEYNPEKFDLIEANYRTGKYRQMERDY